MKRYIITNDSTTYDHIAQPGDRCQVCYAGFLPGETVTAVMSGGIVGLHCGDVEECINRLHERRKEISLLTAERSGRVLEQE